MGLINVLASNVSSVYALVKSYTMNPIVAGVPVQCYQFRATETAEVSKHVLVDLTGGKHFINDNIAPGPHVWALEGYVGGLPIELVGRPEIMPSLRLMHYMLETAYASRAPVAFMDADLAAWPTVAIEELQFEKDPLVQNREIVKITLRELTILSANVFATDLQANGSPQPGNEVGITATAPAPASATLPAPLALPAVPGPATDFVKSLSSAYY